MPIADSLTAGTKVDTTFGTTNDWGKANLGDQNRTAKFLSLMGATKAAQKQTSVAKPVVCLGARKGDCTVSVRLAGFDCGFMSQIVGWQGVGVSGLQRWHLHLC